jgi:glycosyltransferase involved in cell wall biosynthesis
MPKNNNKKNKGPSSMINGKYYPLVSVCTPTFNRRPFIPMMFQCFKNQTYPAHRIEWIIVDDGTDKIEDLINTSGISQIRYFSLPNKLSLGEKRNYMHTHAKGNIIVYMDDDDYYPPERISHAVERLTEDKDALCAGSSEIYIYYKHIHKMYQCGPYGPNHATAGTFAFKIDMLKKCKYENHAELAEERAFLKDYTIPFVQLDPFKTILVFSHNHNTFDKKKMLENPHPQFCKESPRTVDDFIKLDIEAPIKKFFLNDIDNALKTYPVGEPIMKPGVLEQIEKLDKERKAMMQQPMQLQPPANGLGGEQIMMNRPGEPPIPLNIYQAVDIMQKQQEHINMLTQQMGEKDNIIQNMQKEIAKLYSINNNNNNNNTIKQNEKESLLKLDNTIVFNIAD